MPENKVQFGVKNCHFAEITVAEDGSLTYGTWDSVPNAVNFTADPNVASQKEYGDDGLVYEASTTTDATMTLELTTITDEIRKKYLGYEDASDGGLFQVTDGPKKFFGVAIEFNGDAHKTRHVFFKCTLSDGETTQGQTNADNVTFQHGTITLTAYPVPITSDGSKHAIKVKYKEGDTGYSSLFSKPYTMPTLKTAV